MAGNYIGPPGTAGDGRGWRETAENIGKQRNTAGDDRGRRGTAGDNAMSSILVLAQDGRTAPLRALVGRGVSQGVRQVRVQRLPARWREPLGGGA